MPTESPKTLKLIELQVANFLRLTAVTIRPDGTLVIIGGDNSSGKTSTINAIWAALGGRDAIPPDPVHHGADKAVIKLDIGAYIVTRTITPDGKSELSVRGRDGGKFSSPQTILDGLMGELAFDPLEFVRMKPMEQLDTLRGIVKLDFTSLDGRIAGLTEDRTLVGRELRSAQAVLPTMPQHADAPAAERPITTLTAKLDEAQKFNEANKTMRDAHAKAIESRLGWQKHIAKLQEDLAKAQEQVKIWDGKVAEAAKAIVADRDESAILAEMDKIDAVNAQVREKAARAKAATQIEDKQKEYDGLTAQIDACKATKERRLSEAKFPIAGLSFSETGVLLNQVPFEQASSAEKIRTSTAMGIALAGALKIMLIRDASLLDTNSLTIMAEMADAANMQIILERVESDDPCAIIISDGTVDHINPKA